MPLDPTFPDIRAADIPVDVTQMTPEEELKHIYSTTAGGTAKRNKSIAEMVKRRGLGGKGVLPGRQEEEVTPSGLVPFARLQQEQILPTEQTIPRGKWTAEEFEIPISGRFIDPQQQIQQAGFGIGGPGTGRLGALQREYRGLGKQQQKLLSQQAGELQDIYGKRLEAVEMGERAAIQKSAGERAILEERRKNWKRLQEKQQEAEVNRQQILTEETGKLKASMANFQQMKVEPTRLFKNADGSTDYPKAIGAAIAVGLGALGASLPARMGGTGGPNQALGIIQRAIDRDIDAQKSDIASKRMGIGMQQNLLGMMRDEFTDDRQAESATRIQMLQTSEMELDRMAAAAKAPQIRVDYMKMKALIGQEMQSEKYKFDNASLESGMKTTAAEFGMEQSRAAMRQRSMAMTAKAMATRGGKPMPAGELSKMAGFGAAHKIADEVRYMWEKQIEGNWSAGLAQHFPWATEAGSFDDAMEVAAQLIGKKMEGRMTDLDFERFRNMMPSPGETTKRAMAKLDNAMRFLSATEEATLETFGKAGYDVSGFVTKQPVEGFTEVE